MWQCSKGLQFTDCSTSSSSRRMSDRWTGDEIVSRNRLFLAISRSSSFMAIKRQARISSLNVDLFLFEACSSVAKVDFPPTQPFLSGSHRHKFLPNIPQQILDRSKTGRDVFLQSCPSYSFGAAEKEAKCSMSSEFVAKKHFQACSWKRKRYVIGRP